jgi:ABC-type glycerol-3-phosphate transport system substrate-binding protein
MPAMSRMTVFVGLVAILLAGCSGSGSESPSASPSRERFVVDSYVPIGTDLSYPGG